MDNVGKTIQQGRRHTFTGGSDVRQYDHEVLEVARVVRVVKGGRRFRFRAVVVIGDHAGAVGLGIGKSKDVQQAIQKGQDHAAKNLAQVKLNKGTIGHTVTGSVKGATVMLKPARPGTGVIAGGTIRIVANLVGIKDLVSKRYGSANRLSNARATIKALTSSKVRKVKKSKSEKE